MFWALAASAKRSVAAISAGASLSASSVASAVAGTFGGAGRSSAGSAAMGKGLSRRRRGNARGCGTLAALADSA